MGLDNGIVIKYKDGSEEEVCYWRKFWGFRNDVICYLSNKYDYNEELFEYKIGTSEDIQDLREITGILIHFIDEKYFNDNNDSIWSYREYLNVMFDSIKKLIELIWDIDNKDKLEEEEYKNAIENIEGIYFYDS